MELKMNRKEAKKLMSDLVCGTHEECSSNHYRDVDLGVDKIYDDIEKDKRNEQNCMFAYLLHRYLVA